MSNSRKKYFTVIVVPHSEEHPLSFRLPLAALQVAGVFMAMLLIGAFIMFKGYVNTMESAARLTELKETNRIQREKIDLLARDTESLLHQMQRLDLLQEEIKNLVSEDELLAANFKGLDDGLSVKDEEEMELLSSQRVTSSRGDNLVLDRTASNISSMQGGLPGKVDELHELKDAVQDRQKQLAHTPSIMPAQGRLTSPFGPRLSPISRTREFHSGIDIANSTGTPIYAAANGRVVTAQYRRGWGNIIIIDHGYGFRTKYAHLNSFSVEVGSAVEKGELIGRMGSTGYSTGPHLHYEVHINGVPVDPQDYIQ